MIKKIEGLGEDIIGSEAVGVVSAKDYEDVLIPTIESALKRSKKINLLYVLGKDFESYDLKAIYEDSLVGIKHFFDFEKIAIVTNKEWVKNLVKAFEIFYPMEIKIFDEDSVQNAIKWLKEKPKPTVKVDLLEDDKILILESIKPLAKEDFEYVNSIINPFLEKYKELNGVILKIKEFPGWDRLSSMKAHFEFIKKHHEKVKKLAFVTDSSLVEIFEHFAKFVVHPKVKEFAYDKLDEALKWIKEDSV